MTERLIRYSSTQTFLESRRRYYLQYIRKLERDYGNDGYRPAFAFDVGNIGHAALSAHYGRRDVESAIADEIAKANIDPNCEEVKLARQAVTRYMMWLGNQKGRYKIIGNEDRIYLDMGMMHGDRVTLTMQPDLVLEDLFGLLHVLDHKFVANYETLSSFILYNRQGLTYSLGVRAHYGKDVTSFILNQIQRKPPKTKSFNSVQRVVQWQSPEMLAQHEVFLRRVLSDMVQLHQEVEAGDTSGAYPHPTFMCLKACPFKQICCGVVAQPESKVAEIISSEFRMKKDDDL